MTLKQIAQNNMVNLPKTSCNVTKLARAILQIRSVYDNYEIQLSMCRNWVNIK